MTELHNHIDRLKRADLRSLAFKRADNTTLTAAGWTADLARHFLDSDAEQALLAHAESCDIGDAIAALFSADHVNASEDRPALHWALRADGALSDVAGQVRASLATSDAFADAVRAGDIVAASGQPFKNIVHIGIGGSDFGPRLIADAFQMERDRRFTLRFCANLDPLDLDLALDGLKPEETLVIGVSKSFGTEETLYNLTRARDWLRQALGERTADHLALVTSRKDRAVDWLGGADVRTFDMPASIGGRFSLWSNAGLSCRIVLGESIVEAIRTGANEMDRHFRDAPLAENLPVRLALLDYWNRTCLGYPMRVLLAYARRLRMLPTYLQQLEMESNGKSVSPAGETIIGATAPALWGGEGSIGQHSYHQWLHQGTDAVPSEFILAPDPGRDGGGRLSLTAHALAQAEVLANGRSLSEVQAEEPDLPAAIAAQKVHVGGRPSTFLVCSDFGPHAFGSLIALYEHRTYVAGQLWGLNSFDQWGVERGKTMAGRIKAVLSGDATSDDPVTQSLSGKLGA